MSETALNGERAEIARLNKIIRALMDRAERSTAAQGSDFGLFQTSIMLEQQVRERTRKLEEALRENEQITRSLRESEARFRGLVNQSLVGIAIIEGRGFTYTNPKFLSIFGYDADEVRDIGPAQLTSGRDRMRIVEQLERLQEGAVDSVEGTREGLRKDGTIIDVEIHGSIATAEGKRFLVAMVLDVTERVRAQRKIRELKDALEEQATHDELTGLYNRRYLVETLQRELIRADRQGQPLSAIMADLDHFKFINDHYGHFAGDEVLREFGNLLRSNARASDVFCRYGGEEFVLVMPDMTERAACERAEVVRRTLAAEPMLCGAHSVAVTASFGVASFPLHAADADGLISAADKALYAAKGAGRNRVESYSSLAEPAGAARSGAEAPVLIGS